MRCNRWHVFRCACPRHEWMVMAPAGWTVERKFDTWAEAFTQADRWARDRS